MISDRWCKALEPGVNCLRGARRIALALDDRTGLNRYSVRTADDHFLRMPAKLKQSPKPEAPNSDLLAEFARRIASRALSF